MAAVQCDHFIQEQLTANKVKRNKDVVEVYLGKKNLNEVTNLKRFRNLQRVWLNRNKLRKIVCFSHNLRLTEIYLQHNEITSITGSLAHLSTLRILMLHNNQLEKLDRVVRELHHMQDLTVLNLFHNPVAQETDYRLYVIHYLPSVELLDQREVLREERDIATSVYDQDRQAVKEVIGFGRRSQGPPDIFFPGNDIKLLPTIPADFEVGNNFYRSNPPYEDKEEAVRIRMMKKSTMDYSKLDWSKVPRSEERRISNKPYETPQIITVRFR